MMPTESGSTVAKFRAIICGNFPELAGSRFTLLTQGFDSIAVDVDGQLIFKFPRHAEAEARLRMEAAILDTLRPVLTMRIPQMTLHAGPPLFSVHAKLKGEHLLAADYPQLREESRQNLAAEMARFFAELHALDPRAMEAAGARQIGTWLPPQEILREAWPLLPPELRSYAERTIAEYERLPPDPLGTVYGFFDGHGWNMAFDHERQRLNGIYDFGDSGFGPLHREFIQPSWISRDLTQRIVDEYERLTERRIDRLRVDLLTGVLRLSELGGFAKEPERIPEAVRAIAEWAVLTRNGT